MRFLVDHCAGRRLAEWLDAQGHDVVDAGALESDPGDQSLLERAAAEGRVLITIDRDLGAALLRRELSRSFIRT